MPREFRPQYLPTWLMQEVIKRKDDDTVWVWAREWLEKAVQVKPARSAKVTAIMQQTVEALATQAHGLWSNKTNQQRFVSHATATLHDGIQRTYLAGARTHDSSFALNSTIRTQLRQKAMQQSQWLSGLGQVIQTLAMLNKASAMQWLNDNPGMRQRMVLYAGVLHGSYQRGELAGWKSSHNDHPRITWHADSDTPCEHCGNRNAQQFNETEIETFPGEGMFNSDTCAGGPNCRCFLTFEPSGTAIDRRQEPTVRPVPIPQV